MSSVPGFRRLKSGDEVLKEKRVLFRTVLMKISDNSLRLTDHTSFLWPRFEPNSPPAERVANTSSRDRWPSAGLQGPGHRRQYWSRTAWLTGPTFTYLYFCFCLSLSVSDVWPVQTALVQSPRQPVLLQNQEGPPSWRDRVCSRKSKFVWRGFRVIAPVITKRWPMGVKWGLEGWI